MHNALHRNVLPSRSRHEGCQVPEVFRDDRDSIEITEGSNLCDENSVPVQPLIRSEWFARASCFGPDGGSVLHLVVDNFRNDEFC